MTTYERIIELCKENGIKQTSLEKDLGFGRGSIGKMKQYGTSYDRLKKIADYFNVPISYLSGESDIKYEKISDIVQNDITYRNAAKVNNEVSSYFINMGLFNDIKPTLTELDIILAYRNLDNQAKRLILYALRLNELAEQLGADEQSDISPQEEKQLYQEMSDLNSKKENYKDGKSRKAGDNKPS